MRIKVDELPEDGRDVQLGQGDAWALSAATQALDGDVSGLAAELHIERIAEVVRVSGTAEASVTRDCDRCGGPVRVLVGGVVELIYEPTPHPALAEDRVLHESELDIGFFDGKQLDLTDVLMEQLALWMPARVRCTDADVEQIGEPWTCSLPDQDEGPDLTRQNPFANLRLPE